MLLTEILTGTPDAIKSEDPVLNSLSQYHQARQAAMNRACSTVGIDPTGAAAMHEIILAEQQHAPLTPGQLARTLAISTAATTSVINRLTDAGLISRTPHPSDRRKQLLRTTADALPELQSAKAAITELANQLSPHDATLIINLLNALSATLEN